MQVGIRICLIFFFCFLVYGTAQVAEEYTESITLDGVRLEATSKGYFHLYNRKGERTLEVMQIRPCQGKGDIKSYILAFKPVALNRISDSALEFVFEKPYACKVELTLEKAPARDVIPAGINMIVKRRGQWPANLTTTIAGRPMPGRPILAGRVRRVPGSQLTCMAMGAANNRNCNTIFNPVDDQALIVNGPCLVELHRMDFIIGEEGACVTLVNGFYKEGRNLPFFRSVSRPCAPPAGWCSWYAYYLDITEEEMIKNTDWLAKNLKPYGLDFVQLDDGFQLLAEDKEQAKSWIKWNEKFPNGHQHLAKYIHDKGFKAGLWLTPFSQGDPELVKAHPDWFLRDEKGEVVKTFKGAMTLDASNQEVIEQWFYPLFWELASVGQWDYFKIDGQTTVVKAYKDHQARLHSKMSGEEAYRRGLNAIRQMLGPAKYLLNCWGTVTEGIGLVNGARTGGDVWAAWAGVIPAKHATRDWLFTHNVCWHADPDVVCVRPPLTHGQAKVWATLLGLTGQLLMTSDKMYELPEDRVELLRRILPVAPIVPMELYKLEDDQLNIIDLKIRKKCREWDVVGFMNWDRTPKVLTTSIKELGGRNMPHLVYDFWNKKFLGMIHKEISIFTPKQDCTVVSLSPVFTEWPTLISTSRHITMGVVDLLSLKIDQKTRTITGESGKVIPGEDYEIVFYLPPRAPHITATAKDAKVKVIEEDRIARAVFNTQNTWLSWSIQYAEPDKNPPQSFCEKIKIKDPATITPNSISFSWEVEGEAPRCFTVLRNNQVVGAEVVTCMWADNDLKPDTAYEYKVIAQPYGGQLVTASSEVTKTYSTTKLPPPPPEPAVYLSDLKPLSASQGWGELKLDKSVDNNPLTIGGAKFEKGLGTHAESAIEYEIKEEYEIFSAYVGVDQETDQGSVSFEVYVDGALKVKTPVLYSGDLPYGISTMVLGAKTLKLVVKDGGDNIHYDHADWAQAGFVLKK